MGRAGRADGRVAEHGFCEVHGKRGYMSRKDARRAARSRHHADKGLRAYACGVVDGMWHLGHLPDVVRTRGVVSADAIFGSAYRKKGRAS